MAPDSHVQQEPNTSTIRSQPIVQIIWNKLSFPSMICSAGKENGIKDASLATIGRRQANRLPTKSACSTLRHFQLPLALGSLGFRLILIAFSQ